MRSGHKSKGHQSADGKVFAAGDYLSDFMFSVHGLSFCNRVFFCLSELLCELTTHVQEAAGDEEEVAARIHQKMILTNLYSHVKHSSTGSGATDFLISHTACYCCLFGQAEHSLPCGHVLCSACVRTYGRARGPNDIEIFQCPIEGSDSSIWPPWRIQLKPKFAGVRVLTLDG